jgi:hypothetical protein
MILHAPHPVEIVTAMHFGIPAADVLDRAGNFSAARRLLSIRIAG